MRVTKTDSKMPNVEFWPNPLCNLVNSGQLLQSMEFDPYANEEEFFRPNDHRP